MAQRYTEQATKQLAPLYDQQAKTIGAQLPAIQQLYQTLMGGLDTSYNQQLNTGIMQINEDASARGVLRSTLPNDSRLALTGQLGQALMEGKAQLGRQQAGEVAGINEKLGTLGINRANDIASLARSLETQDLDKQKFEWQKQMDQQQLQIERAKIAAANSGGGSKDVSNAEMFAAGLAQAAGDDGKVSPGNYNALKNQWVSAGYGSYKDFHDRFWQFANEKHWWDYR